MKMKMKKMRKSRTAESHRPPPLRQTGLAPPAAKF
jgi:hypothetical protein